MVAINQPFVVLECVSISSFFAFSWDLHLGHQITTSTLTYLTGLAVADFFTALLILPIGFVRCIDTKSWDLQYAFNFYEKYVYRPFGNTFMTISVWTNPYHNQQKDSSSFTAMVERYQDKVCNALVQLRKIIVASLYFMAICFNIPLFMYYEDLTGDEDVGRSDFADSVGYWSIFLDSHVRRQNHPNYFGGMCWTLLLSD